MYNERIPMKTAAITLSGSSVLVDAEGLEVTLFADGGDVLIKKHTTDADSDAFKLPDGSRITLGGDFVIGGTGATARLLYCKTL